MSKRTTTPAQARKETVAEEEPREDQAAAEPTSESVAEPEKTPLTEPAVANDAAVDKGMCDNHPDRPAVVITPFTWTPAQRFCNLCVPAQYRYLLP